MYKQRIMNVSINRDTRELLPTVTKLHKNIPQFTPRTAYILRV